MASDPTSIWTGIISSVISAVAGLGGVALGAHLTGLREATREKERLQRESRYLVALIVAHLDRFATGCLAVAFDDGTSEGRPASEDGTEYEPTVELPTFDPLVLGVEWKVLPPELMFGILNLPGRLDRLRVRIAAAAEYDEPPLYREFFWTRRDGFAALGLEVSDLVRRLRLHAGAPVDAYEEGESSPEVLLQEQRDKVKQERADYEARIAVRSGSL